MSFEMPLEEVCTLVVCIAVGAVQAMVVSIKFLVLISQIFCTECFWTCLAFERFSIVILRVHMRSSFDRREKAERARFTLE